MVPSPPRFDGFSQDLPTLEDDLETSGSDYPFTLVVHFADATAETQAPQFQAFSDATKAIRNNFTHTHTHSEPHQYYFLHGIRKVPKLKGINMLILYTVRVLVLLFIKKLTKSAYLILHILLFVLFYILYIFYICLDYS